MKQLLTENTMYNLQPYKNFKFDSLKERLCGREI